jgi:hypothetical protein
LLSFGVGVSGLSNQLAIVVLHVHVIYCTVHLERGVLVQSILYGYDYKHRPFSHLFLNCV